MERLRGRLLSLAVAESLVYASLGGIAGLVLGGWALRVALPVFAGSLPPAIPIDIDARVAVFTASISASLGLICSASSSRCTGLTAGSSTC